MEVVNALGRRKSAVARIFVTEGTGKITINKRDLAEYFPSSILQYVVKQPLNKLEVAEKYDIKVNLNGGGLNVRNRVVRKHVVDSSSVNVNEGTSWIGDKLTRIFCYLQTLLPRQLTPRQLSSV